MRRRRGQGFLLGAPIALFAVLAWTHRNVIDDGFIYLRVVHHVTAGHGPVFNTGERVEAVTSPLWLGVLSAADALTPVRLEWLAVVIGIGATVAALVLVVAASSRLVRFAHPDALLLPAGLLVLIAIVPMWFYASSGLETGITFLWLATCLLLLTRWSTSGTSLRVGAAVVLGLGWLVRPELVVYSVVFLVLVLVEERNATNWRHRARIVAAALALPAAYQVFRMGYYSALIANTAIAKEGARVRFQRGWRYFTDFVTTYWMMVPFGLLVAGAWYPLLSTLRRTGHRRATLVVAAFLVAGGLNALYVVAVGGDYEHARLLLPAVFAVCAPVAVVPLARRYVFAIGLAPWALVALVGARPPPTSLGRTFALPNSGLVTVDDHPKAAQWRRLVTNGSVIIQRTLTDFDVSHLPPAPGLRAPAAVVVTAGAFPYAVGDDVYVLDSLGLADPLTARLDVPRYTSLVPYPGHEKQLPNPWIAARLYPPGADVRAGDLLDPGFPPLIPATHGTAFEQQVDVARAALDCAPLRRLHSDTTARLTPSRFVHNVVDSFANTFLRVSPDPAQAYRDLCGANPHEAASHRRVRPRSTGALPDPQADPDRTAVAWQPPPVGRPRPSPRAHGAIVSLSGFV